MESSGQSSAPSIKRLDFNIAYACNLACKGCISLSDHPRKGVESVDSIQQQLDTWCTRITPQVVTVFGGEPLLHPRIHSVIERIKLAWPQCTVRLITNGYLLAKHDASSWFDYEPFEMQVSIHRKDHEDRIHSEIKRILDCRDNWSVRRSTGSHKDLEFTSGEFTIYKSYFGEFVVPYKTGFKPYHSDPEKAHAVCGAPDTPVLYKNRLYKCPPVANILDMFPNYADYDGVGHNQDLTEFVDSIGKPESICAMCPENKNNAVDHYAENSVEVKHD